MSDDFPRLLVATEFPPNATGGGPAVVRQMLKKWPTQQLFWWSAFADPSSPFTRKVAAHRVAIIPAKLYPYRRCLRLKSWLLENGWATWATSHFRKTVRLFHPEVVWVIPHQWAILPLARVLLRHPVPFHTTVQDYVTTRGNTTRFGEKRARYLGELADRLYIEATTRDATSHPMAADLLARTGAEATQVVHAGLEAEDFAYLANKMAPLNDPIRIAYAGTVVAEMDFELIVAALGRARSRLPVKIELEFFGANSYCSRHWFDPSWMHEQGNLAHADLMEKLRRCTWGLVQMPLSDADRQYGRFSFPTKFITCIAAGLPIIAAGHPQSSVSKLASMYSVGICLTSPDPAAVEDALVYGLSIQNPWLRFRSEIERCAHAEFEASKMRNTLYRCFASQLPQQFIDHESRVTHDG